MQYLILCHVIKGYLVAFWLPPKPCLAPILRNGSYCGNAKITRQQKTPVLELGAGSYAAKMVILRPVLRKKNGENTSFSLHMDLLTFLVLHHSGLKFFNVQPACHAWGSPSTTLGNQTYENVPHWFKYQTPINDHQMSIHKETLLVIIKIVFESWNIIKLLYSVTSIIFLQYVYIFQPFNQLIFSSKKHRHLQEISLKFYIPKNPPFHRHLLGLRLRGIGHRHLEVLLGCRCGGGWNGWVVKQSLRKHKARCRFFELRQEFQCWYIKSQPSTLEHR